MAPPHLPPCTLAVDCGGTGIKAAVLDGHGAMVSDRVRIQTPYPCPPARLVDALTELAGGLPEFDRVSVGLPGVVRAGRVLTTPHYVTEAGPFTTVRPDLVEEWRNFDVADALGRAWGRPVRAVNDAEMHGLAVVAGAGYEVVLTLGTGLGFAHFLDGVPLPKIEMSAHPITKRHTYDERLGDHARRRVGNERWTRRVIRAVRTLQRVFWWDRAYVGGGNARHLTSALPEVTVVPNDSALLGGVRLWDSRARLG
ncbi:MAG: ROK family protein [Actinomycetota bacterium]|nr:ROK family protein [Actinomycetota bacterium]